MCNNPWQLIETAPKDGTWVLVLGIVAGHLETNKAAWIESPRITGHKAWFIAYSLHKVGWETDMAAIVQPLYWMPLPDLPPGVES